MTPTAPVCPCARAGGRPLRLLQTSSDQYPPLLIFTPYHAMSSVRPSFSGRAFGSSAKPRRALCSLVYAFATSLHTAALSFLLASTTRDAGLNSTKKVSQSPRRTE